MVIFTVDIKNLDQLQAQFAQAPQTTTREVMNAVNLSLLGYQSGIKQNAPVRTGRYRSSVTVIPATQTGSTIHGSVGPATNYSEAIENGTGIYGPRHRPITPTRGKALMFTINGRKVFAKSVKGMQGKHPVGRAFTEGQPRTDRIFEQAGENIANAIAGGAR